MQSTVSSDVFTDIKQGEVNAVVYRCQHVNANCEDATQPHPCASCKAFSYGTVSFTSTNVQKTWEWRIHDWIVRQAERVIRRLGGQPAVDEFRHQLTINKQTKEQ